MTLLEKIKKSMRIKHNGLDDNIQSDMNVAALDMIRVGVSPYQKDAEGAPVLDEDGNAVYKDNLVEKAIEMYCKAESDFQGKGDQYRKSYESLKDGLSLSGEYNA